MSQQRPSQQKWFPDFSHFQGVFAKRTRKYLRAILWHLNLLSEASNPTLRCCQHGMFTTHSLSTTWIVYLLRLQPKSKGSISAGTFSIIFHHVRLPQRCHALPYERSRLKDLAWAHFNPERLLKAPDDDFLSSSLIRHSLISVHSQLTSTNQSAAKKLTAADGMFYIRAVKTSSFSTSSFFFTMLCFTPIIIWEKY